ncbi:MAG: preprotein translocase subunit YajC [Candidatus Desulfaltia sp.]|nr:preprotein translocase subunit YajC [Candidatus Desulfaltia sp.]
MIDIAYAMGQGGAAGQGGGGLGSFVPLILMFVIFYFLLIRPQQKKQKAHRLMVENIKNGDQVITTGGIHGRVTSIGEGTLTIEVAERVRIKINRTNVSTLLQSSPQAQPAKIEKTDSDKK